MPFDYRNEVYSRERGFDSMKKLFTMILSVALLATMVVGGTLAQVLLSPIDFNNKDKQKVLIEQDVTVSQLIPPYSDYTVSVTNKSNDDVYVRTLLAFEVLDVVPGASSYLHFDEAAIQPVMEYVGGHKQQVRIAVDNKQYDVYECYYTMEPNATVHCLQGFTFDAAVTCTDFVDGQYRVMALSQALMAESDVESAEIAVPENMKQLFGAVTGTNHPWNRADDTAKETVQMETNIEIS